MKTQYPNHARKGRISAQLFRFRPACAGSLLALSLAACLAPSAQALSTVTINAVNTNYPTTLNYWAGVNTGNTLGVGSNTVTVAGADATTNLLSVSGLPAGVTAVLSTNQCTNSIALGLVLNVTNVTAGAYTLALNSSDVADSSTASANVNLFVVPQWIATNTVSTWGVSSNWSSGSAPSAGSSVYIENQTGHFTNIVDSSYNIGDLVMIGDDDANLAVASICGMQINAGATLTVQGTNGFLVGVKTSNSCRPYYNIFGSGALVVTNQVANFAIASGASSSSTRALSLYMTNLNTFSATVNRFGVGDTTLNLQGLLGGNLAQLSLAKTNTIVAVYSDNYAGLSFQNALQFQANGDLGSGSVNPVFTLGLTNGIYADSVGIGREGAQGSGGITINGGGSTMRFLPMWSNSVAPIATAYFANTNGSRMSLLAIGVDSGTASVSKNTKGTLDLRGGNVTMNVDQIWIARNRTNQANPVIQGALLTDWGNYNANTVQVGYMEYTNAAAINGFLLVGTNGNFHVNNYLELGYTPTNSSTVANWPSTTLNGGQVQINNGGTLYANQINVGLYSTNGITINPGGTLVVSNTIGAIGNSLSTLNLNGGSMTFFVTNGIINAYVTNLLTTTTPTLINIASAPAGQSTNVLIAYQSASAPTMGIGTLPPGFNNMQIVVDNTAKTVSLVVSTNAPKNLVWRGTANAQWDHASFNWYDTNAAVITKFTDGDKVTFDDSTSVTNITITDNVNPGQTGTGIFMTNKVNQYNFSGSYSIGSCNLIMAGTNSVEFDANTAISATVNHGLLTIGSPGTLANVTTLAGTTFVNNGNVSGGVTTAGTFTNNGTVASSLTINGTGTVLNGSAGTVEGSLSLATGSYLDNQGLFTAIGTVTIPTNTAVLNEGTIYGTTLTVAAGGTLTDDVIGTTGSQASSLNLTTLTVNGTFYPGGTGNATVDTIVTDYSYSTGSQQGAPAGRIQLNAGSVTTMRVNLTNTPTSSQLFSQSIVLGGSTSAKNLNGCTLLITNVGPTAFAAGQSFKLFGQYYSGGNPGNAGLNTTNSYPKIIPAVPGPGLAWDESQIYSSGTLSVVTPASLQNTLTNSISVVGSNAVVSLSWDASYIGNGWVQQQITTLTNGLGTNWTDIGSTDYTNAITLTNVISSGAVFYRFVIP